MRLDIERTCELLQKLQAKLGAPPDTDPLRAVAISLHFLWGNGHLHNFEDYLACFNRDASCTASASFDTRDQAEAWLQQPMDPRQARSMAIAGIRYCVGYSLERGVRFLVRTPENTELATARQTTSPLVNESLAALSEARAHIRSPEDMESVNTALLALHFILESGQLLGFESFLDRFDSTAPPLPLCSFSTRQEADTWLSAHPRPPHGAQVEIAGQRYSIGYSRDSGLRVLVRAPALDVG
jgi:hypothetical protein